MRYRGQAFELNTPWEGLDDVDAAAVAGLIRAFHALHLQRYAHAAEDDAVEIVTIRARAIGRMSRDLVMETPVTAAAEARTRPVWRDGWQETEVRRRDTVGTAPVAGPAVIVEDYSVLWIAPGWSVRAAEGGDLIAERG